MILLITSGAVLVTLITSIRQLNMQRELWEEEHRPKILINIKEVTRSNDTVFVVSAIKNYGFEAATKPTMSMHIYDALGNKIGLTSNSWPSLDPGRIYDFKTPFKPNLAKRIRDTFYIEMQMEYGWFKDSSEYKYDASFLLDFDSAASKYNSKIITEGKIPWR